jgi:hypothetical protein
LHIFSAILETIQIQIYAVTTFFLDSALLAQARQDVLQAFAFPDLHLFNPVWVLLATWHNVTFSGSQTSQIVSTEAVNISE